MSRYPDLVQGTKLDTSFANDYTVHEYDDSEDEQPLARPSRRVEHWATERSLAEGGFGEVYLQRCVNGRRRVEWRAVKVLLKQKSRAKKINYVTELEAIAKFSQKRYSKCFVKLLGWYDTDDRIFIAMEYFPLGDLQQYISGNLPLPEPDARHVSYQVLEGLNYMHSEDFAHRDIKPGNILIKSRPPDGSWWVKLSDFGISKRFHPSTEQLSTIKGTISYMPPEAFSHGPGTPVVINHQAADMWSVGEVVFRMLAKTAAFPSLHALLGYLARPDFFPSKLLQENGAGEQARDFIQSLMRPAPEVRLTSSQALDHPWLQPLRPSVPVISPIDSRSDSTSPIPLMVSGPATGIKGWATVSSTDMSMSHASLSVPLRPTVGPLTTGTPETSDDPDAPFPLQPTPEHSKFVSGSCKPIDYSFASFRSQGKYDEAEAMHQKAPELHDETLDSDDSDFELEDIQKLDSMKHLYRTLCMQGKYNEAEAVCRKALPLSEKTHVVYHSDTLDIMHDLRIALVKQDKYDEAEAICRTALKLAKNAYGSDDFDTLAIMDNLGTILDKQGKYDEAEVIRHKVLVIREKKTAIYHDETEAIWRKALTLSEEKLGPDHPDTLNHMSELGCLYNSQRRYDKAEVVHRKALALREKVLGRDHPDTFASMNKLATVLDGQGKYDEAKQVRKEKEERKRRIT